MTIFNVISGRRSELCICVLLWNEKVLRFSSENGCGSQGGSEISLLSKILTVMPALTLHSEWRVRHVKEQVICKQEFEMDYWKQSFEDLLQAVFPGFLICCILDFHASVICCHLSVLGNFSLMPYNVWRRL